MVTRGEKPPVGFAGGHYYKVKFGVHFERWKKIGNVYFGERRCCGDQEKQERICRESETEVRVDCIRAQRSTKSLSMGLSEWS